MRELTSVKLWATNRLGRPDLREVFADTRDAVFWDSTPVSEGKGDVRVCVLACGPPEFMSSAKALCWKFSSSGVCFDYHGEKFQF